MENGRKKESLLSTYLTPGMIKLNFTVQDWEGAVSAGGELLLGADKCTPAYVDAMVRVVREMGPYMVLAPGLALPHARPEDGARGIGISLVTLAPPVNFGSKVNDPVHLVLAFCAPDHDSHMDLLAALAAFLRREASQRRLRRAESIEDVLAALIQEN